MNSSVKKTPIIGRAMRQDCDQVYELVNLAYELETGDSGIAFRTGKKFRLKDIARKNLDEMFLLRMNRKVIGCVKAATHNSVCEIGYLAVHPDYQGQGYGSELMDKAEMHAKGCNSITIGIPTLRQDIIPFFTKRGYTTMMYKTIEEISKLYPEDMALEYLTRKDFKWQILLKSNKKRE